MESLPTCDLGWQTRDGLPCPRRRRLLLRHVLPLLLRCLPGSCSLFTACILTGLSAPYPACSVTYLKDELQMSSSQSATMTQIWSGTCYLTPLFGAFIAGGWVLSAAQ